MYLDFCILFKHEFSSLLNNLVIKGIPHNRIFSENKIHERLLEIPQFDYDEDIIIVKNERRKEFHNEEDHVFNLYIEHVLEFIPITETSFFAYQRKFSQEIVWTEPSKYGFESAYNCFLALKMKNDSIFNLEMCQNFLLKIEDLSLLKPELIEKVVKGKIDKQLHSKKDIEIHQSEYDHIYQSLIVYEQGSHMPRENALGFLLHAFCVIILHDGNGLRIGTKMNLKKFRVFDELKEINQENSFKCFDEIFSDSNILETILKNDQKKVGIEKIKIITYFLFYHFLTAEKNVSFRNVLHIINELKGDLDFTIEEKVAFQLLAMNYPTSKIAEDVMCENENVQTIKRLNHPIDKEYEFISKYYKSNKIQFKEDPVLDYANIKPNDIHDVIALIKSTLPAKFINSTYKKEYFNSVVLEEFETKLFEVNFDINCKKQKDALFKHIFPVKPRNKKP